METVSEKPKNLSDQEREPVNTTGLPLNIPSGFSIADFATDLPGPRVLAMDPKGNLLVSLTVA